MDDPNVLLVVLDSTRARNTGLYGYHRDTTPFLERYSARSTVYRQARAPGIHSVASHASLWTGAHVENHGIVRHEDELKGGTTVWESLGDAGYTTGIFTTNPVVAHASNLAEPFDERSTDDFVETDSKLFPDAHGPADVVKHEGIKGNLERCLGDDKPLKALANSFHHFWNQWQGSRVTSMDSKDVVDSFAKWQSDVDGPWAACINLMDTHFPYEPSERFDKWGESKLASLHTEFDKPPANEFIQGRPWWQLEAFEHLYDGTIREADAHVERIVEELEDSGVHEDTLVVVTSDHGEGFGEISPLTSRSRLVDHSWGIHEVLTHVPLIVKYPGQTKGVEVEDVTSLVAFPDAVDDVRKSRATPDSFVSELPVVASTIRLREEDDGIFEGSSERATDYYGPWRAVWKRQDGMVRKISQRNDRCLALSIKNPQETCLDGDGERDLVESAFDSLEPRDLRKDGTNEVSQDVEEKLTDLGYLR